MATVLPTRKPISPKPSTSCKIIPTMVRLRAPISLSTAILRSGHRFVVGALDLAARNQIPWRRE